MIDALGQPRRILLLGGTSDIALAIARAYAEAEPVDVVLAARPSSTRAAAAAGLTAAGCRVTELDFEKTFGHGTSPDAVYQRAVNSRNASTARRMSSASTSLWVTQRMAVGPIA